MEAEQTIKLVDRILSFLSKLKCKITCCCRSSCALDGEEDLSGSAGVPQIERMTEL